MAGRTTILDTSGATPLLKLDRIAGFLKERNPSTRIVAVEPANVSALLGQEPGLHRIEGIGDGFIPDVLDVKAIDDVITVADDDAINTAQRLTREEGARAGTSSGASVWAATDLAKRYFSTALI